MLLVIIPIIAAAIAFFVYVKYRQDAIEEEFRAKFEGREILHLDKSATFVSRDSDRQGRIRGRGYLVLTKSELYFSAILTQKHVSVPTESIRHVQCTKQAGSRGAEREVLEITFTDRDGHHDSIVLVVENLGAWIAALKPYESSAAAATPTPDAAPAPEEEPESVP